MFLNLLDTDSFFQCIFEVLYFLKLFLSYASCSVGPCALTSISLVTQCNSDTILVEWELTEDTPLYVVTAEGHDQSLISCNSSSTSCELQDIRCGMHYSIIVSASSDKCSSLRSPPKKIKTGIFAAHQTSWIYFVTQ